MVKLSMPNRISPRERWTVEVHIPSDSPNLGQSLGIPRVGYATAHPRRGAISRNPDTLTSRRDQPVCRARESVLYFRRTL